MVLSKQDAEKALKTLEGATVIRCICHRNPDGDAIGSVLGIGLLLEKVFPDKKISFHCKDEVPETFHFLQGALRICPPPNPTPGPSPTAVGEGGKEVIVFVDTAEPKLSELHQSHPHFFDKSRPTIVIDHHPTNTFFGTLHFVDPQAASTCEIIVQFADALKWPLDPDIATCLLTGVYTDTGGLLHSNTSVHVYRTVARLLRAGARRQQIVNAVFRSSKLSTLRLWGRVLEKISVSEEGGAVSAVTEGDFRATGADHSELTGAIDFVNAVPGVRFSLVLSERDGKVKGSLRTLRDDVDVSAMAGKYQGGGHKKAAGFAVTGRLKPEVRWKVIEEPSENDQKGVREKSGQRTVDNGQ